GGFHTCALKTDGTLWCWGANNLGQLGDGTTVNKTTPVQAGAAVLGSDVAEVALGIYNSCARKTDGTLWCWGGGGSGQPSQVGAATLGSAVAEIAVGGFHSCARKTDGTLWCWGDNSSGQLGDGTTVSKTLPVEVGAAPLGDDVAEIALGDYSSCAR